MFETLYLDASTGVRVICRLCERDCNNKQRIIDLERHNGRNTSHNFYTATIRRKNTDVPYNEDERLVVHSNFNGNREKNVFSRYQKNP